MHAKNGILFIDEIENGLHHTVLEKVFAALANAAADYSCQIIATTHSHECIYSAHKAFISLQSDAFRFIRLDKKEDTVEAKTFNNEQLSMALDSDLEVR